MGSMKFRAVVEPSGNATAVEVPVGVVEALGAGKRPPVVITVNGHTWRSRVAAMRGKLLVGISAANRAAAGIAEGEEIEMDLLLDEEPKVVAEPDDLGAALDGDPRLRAAYDGLAQSHRRRYVLDIERAKTPATRRRRIDAVIDALGGR